MWSLLGQILVALLAAVALGLTMGVLLVRSKAERERASDVSERETRTAALQEELRRARSDLEAHAVELADANEEITCLLEALHEARQREPDRGARPA